MGGLQTGLQRQDRCTQPSGTFGIDLAALLFAFPLIRTLLPGDPPLGVLADFAGYFWIEAITGFSLLALLVARICREHHDFA